MKKVTFFLCFILLVASLAGCSSGADDTPEDLIGTWESTIIINDTLLDVMDYISESADPIAAQYYSFEGITFRAIYTFDEAQTCTITLEEEAYRKAISDMLVQIDIGTKKLIAAIPEHTADDGSLDETGEAMMRLSVHMTLAATRLEENPLLYFPEAQSGLYDVSLGKLFLTDYTTHEVTHNRYELNGDTLILPGSGYVDGQYKLDTEEEPPSMIAFPQTMTRIDSTT